MPKCEGCGRTVKEVCGGDHCRACHVSCSWEDCTSGTFEARNYYASLRGHVSDEEARKMVKEIYPTAKI